MPGLLGTMSMKDDIAATSQIAAMASRMRYEPEFAVETRGGADCALGYVGITASSYLAEADDQLLAYDGVFADLSGLRERLKSKGAPLPADASIAALLLAAWRAFGTEALQGLNGLYVIAIWDARARRMTLLNDRYGFRKLSYAHVREGLFFCSELKGLLAVECLPKGIDHVAVAQFLRMTYFLEDRTLYERIKRAPPGTVITYCDGRFKMAPYGGLHFGDPSANCNKADVLAETAEKIRRAVARRLSPNTALLLTGGLDSRAIAGAAYQLGLPEHFIGASIGHDPCHDISYGRRIAQAVGMPHETLKIGPDYLAAHAQAASQRMEGAVSMHGCWHVVPDVLARQNGVHTVMTGSITTGVRSAEPRLNTLPRKYQWWHRHEGAIRFEFEHHLSGGFTDAEMPSILPPGSGDELVHAAYEAVRRRFHAAPTDWVPSKIDYATMMEYERRYIGVNFDMLGALVDVQAPFLDNDLVDYTWEVKPAFPLGANDFKEMIVKHFPEVAGIPQTNSWLAPNASWIRSKATRAAMRFYYRILPRLSRGRYGGHDYGAYAHHNEWIRTGSRPFVEQTLGREELLEGLVNLDTARLVLKEHMEGNKNSYNKICMLMSLAMFRADTDA